MRNGFPTKSEIENALSAYSLEIGKFDWWVWHSLNNNFVNALYSFSQTLTHEQLTAEEESTFVRISCHMLRETRGPELKECREKLRNLMIGPRGYLFNELDESLISEENLDRLLRLSERHSLALAITLRKLKAAGVSFNQARLNLLITAILRNSDELFILANNLTHHCSTYFICSRIDRILASDEFLRESLRFIPIVESAFIADYSGILSGLKEDPSTVEEIYSIIDKHKSLFAGKSDVLIGYLIGIVCINSRRENWSASKRDEFISELLKNKNPRSLHLSSLVYLDSVSRAHYDRYKNLVRDSHDPDAFAQNLVKLETTTTTEDLKNKALTHLRPESAVQAIFKLQEVAALSETNLTEVLNHPFPDRAAEALIQARKELPASWEENKARILASDNPAVIVKTLIQCRERGISAANQLIIIGSHNPTLAPEAFAYLAAEGMSPDWIRANQALIFNHELDERTDDLMSPITLAKILVTLHRRAPDLLSTIQGAHSVNRSVSSYFLALIVLFNRSIESPDKQPDRLISTTRVLIPYRNESRRWFATYHIIASTKWMMGGADELAKELSQCLVHEAFVKEYGDTNNPLHHFFQHLLLVGSLSSKQAELFLDARLKSFFREISVLAKIPRLSISDTIYAACEEAEGDKEKAIHFIIEKLSKAFFGRARFDYPVVVVAAVAAAEIQVLVPASEATLAAGVFPVEASAGETRPSSAAATPLLASARTGATLFHLPVQRAAAGAGATAAASVSDNKTRVFRL